MFLHLTLGLGGAITLHCTYTLVLQHLTYTRQNQHRGCKDQSIEWRIEWRLATIATTAKWCLMSCARSVATNDLKCCRPKKSDASNDGVTLFMELTSFNAFIPFHSGSLDGTFSRSFFLWNPIISPFFMVFYVKS